MSVPGRVERGRESTREALLTAVEELVRERGWAACSLQAVSRRAGLTTGAVYSTFGSRGGLLAAAMVRMGQHAGIPADEPDLRTAVEVFARHYYEASTTPEGRNLAIAQLDLVRLGHADPAIRESLRETYLRVHQELADDLRARATEPLPGPAFDVALKLNAVMQGLLLHNVGFDAQLPLESFVSAALEAVGLLPNINGSDTA